MGGRMILRVWDVEHGACAMIRSTETDRLAMIDSGHNDSDGWRPSTYIKRVLGRDWLDYLLITNADQDHMSDLEGLWQQGIDVRTLYRNHRVTPEQLRLIKEQQSEITDDVERFLSIHKSYNAPVTEPFDDYMGGITISTFGNEYPTFKDTNNLSLVVFVKFGTFKMLFPGDLEKAGWLKLLENPAFVEELKGTTILNASHHGRENGLCEEIFKYFTPSAVVISDKQIVHETQKTVGAYYNATTLQGVKVMTTGETRWVLTTRNEGWIEFEVNSSGDFNIRTENGA